MDYTTFAEQCLEELKVLQDKFQAESGLNWYENWFYNQATGLLTCSTEETELNFKYFEAGTFSTKSNTWKWSWDNDSTLDNVKEKSLLVKEFGETSGYPKLTDGYFPSDEFDAWEFTAIAAKLTNGIGVYRPVSDGLQIYLVITAFVDNETAKNIKNKYVQCSAHEYRRIAYACQHLNHTSKVGFVEPFDTYEDMELTEDDELQAWCNECEAVRQEEGEWNERAIEFTQSKIVCEKCYFEMKEFNLGHR